MDSNTPLGYFEKLLEFDKTERLPLLTMRKERKKYKKKQR